MEQSIQQKNIITRKVVKDYKDMVEKVDTDNNLEMFCYTTCNNDSPQEIKQCRGIVFDGDKLVMSSFPYTPEYTEINFPNDITDDMKFYESYEGALIRLFYYNNKWYISTHKKFDAFKSKWSSRESFGISFSKALEAEYQSNKELQTFINNPEQLDAITKLTNVLNKSYQYMFLVLNNKENRIVCQAPETPKLYFVGTFIDGNLSMSEDIKIPYPQEVKFSTREEIVDYIKNIDIRKSQGLICVGKDNILYKILSSRYVEYFNVRGNEASIKFRYLQVRHNKDYVNKLIELYPHMVPTFNEYYNIIFQICQNIYRAYVGRYIKKQFITIPKEEFFVMKQCHDWYLTNPTEHRISLQQVINIMNQQTPVHINRLIKKFKEDKKQQEISQDFPPLSK